MPGTFNGFKPLTIFAKISVNDVCVSIFIKVIPFQVGNLMDILPRGNGFNSSWYFCAHESIKYSFMICTYLRNLNNVYISPAEISFFIIFFLFPRFVTEVKNVVMEGGVT